MMAMLAIGDSSVLKELGYTLLLQIHDEVILEGSFRQMYCSGSWSGASTMLDCTRADGRGPSTVRARLDPDLRGSLVQDAAVAG